MTRRHVHRVHVEFGDCDPAGIVHFPHYFRWMDAAAWHCFAASGIASWSAFDDAPDLIGTPVVDASAKFLRPASFGDDLEIETTIVEWRHRSFVLSHVVRRGGDTLVEGREVRVFAARDPADPRGIRAVPPPASVRRLLGADEAGGGGPSA